MANYRGTPKEIAQEIRDRVSLYKRYLKEAESDSLKEGKRLAEQYSSGPYKDRMLAALGHPYSQRKPNPPLPPGYINVQSGKFKARFRAAVFYKTWAEGRKASALYNTDPVWPLLKKGTRLMISRPLGKMVASALRPKRLQNLAMARHRAMRP